MSKNQIPQTQYSENQRIIKEWLKRNNSGRIIIGPNDAEVKSQNQNGKPSLPVIVSVTKKDDKNDDSMKSNLLPIKRENTKCNSIESNMMKTKIARWSSPTVSIKIEPIDPSTKDVDPKCKKKEFCSNSESSITLKQVPSDFVKDKSLAKNNLEKSSVLPKTGIKNGKNHKINRRNITIPQIKDGQDVYSSVQENYKYLLTPKYWSVNEFENDSHKQCIVFSKPHVVNENEKLIAMMQKSLIIDKKGTIHYSVHGLPINVKGTILPDALDSIKKLLSILHIFDKMQVCKGLGDDLLIVKTDSLFKDICQVWRHTDCKLLLVKAEQCQTCVDTRNSLLEKEMLFKSELLSMELVDTRVKEDQN